MYSWFSACEHSFTKHAKCHLSCAHVCTVNTEALTCSVEWTSYSLVDNVRMEAAHQTYLVVHAGPKALEYAVLAWRTHVKQYLRKIRRTPIFE